MGGLGQLGRVGRPADRVEGDLAQQGRAARVVRAAGPGARADRPSPHGPRPVRTSRHDPRTATLHHVAGPLRSASVLPFVPAAAAAVVAAALLPAGPVASTAAGPDPSAWGDRRLAAQLTISCVDMAHLDRAERHAARGIGAITLLGTPPANLRRHRGGPAGGVPPLCAGDAGGPTVVGSGRRHRGAGGRRIR